MCSPDEAVICVDNISKYFEMYAKPSHRLWQMLFRGKRCFYTPYWALRDISFTVGKGECVGIIGHNGAGKSTLLQIITGTLAPSAGSVHVQGRIAALLELGSGFNPEFTGRENVYLNASIHGLTKEEIDQRYNDIVAFADIGDFIDQPVKSYSSGMVVRLAFAVVVHVDADVLIIDEALAVGDAYFTQKCMRFLRHFIAKHTVLFVSHDTAAVNSLCNRALLLEQGRIKHSGSPKEVTETYLKNMYEMLQGTSALPLNEGDAGQDDLGQTHTTRPEDPRSTYAPGRHSIKMHRPEDYCDMRDELSTVRTLRHSIPLFSFYEENTLPDKGGVTITQTSLVGSAGTPLSWVTGGESVTLDIIIHAHKDIVNPIVEFYFKNRFGQNIFGDNTFLSYRESHLSLHAGQKAQIRFTFIMPILEAGDYSVDIYVTEGIPEAPVRLVRHNDALILKSVSTSCTTGMVGIPMQGISIEVA